MAQYQDCFECDICNRTFTRKYNLRTHISNCHMNFKCYCEICETNFGSTKGLQKHLSRGHNRYQQGYPECDICGRIFTRKQNIMSHMLTVHLQGCRRQIICPLCKKSFTTKRNLKRHLNHLHNSDVQYPTCDDCNKVFKDKYSLLVHVQTTHNFTQKILTKCDICDKEYTNNRSLKRHIEMYHGERSEYKCGLCPKVYTSNQSLRRHTRSIHIAENIQNFKCDTCSDIFVDEKEYAFHIVNCKQENWLPSSGVDNVCGTCGIYFHYEPHLRQHVKEEHSFNAFYDYCRDFLLRQQARKEVLAVSKKQNVDFNCEYCNMAFANVYDLKEHMSSKHEKEYSMRSCYVCFTKFFSRESLNEHKKICVPPPNTHNCNFCERLFTDISSLDFHKKIFHPYIPTSETVKNSFKKNNHKCTHCNRVYYSDRSLKHHMKLKHTTEEAVQCGFCGKICSNKYYLISHIKLVHTDNTISKCDYCDKEFRSKRNIRRHIEYTHLGMQRYKCIECETLFKEKRSLRKHVRVKHPNSTTFPQCHICKKRFESAKSCKIHLKLVHSYNVDSHPCDLCSVSFISLQALKIHLQSNHLAEDEIYKCEECNIVFKGQENFDNHNDKYHINADPTIQRKSLPRCVICIKDFSTRKTLKRHIKNFHKDFDVEDLANYGMRKKSINVDCEECLKCFHDEQYSTVHEKLKYAKDMIVFRCGYCGAAYTVLEYAIQRHRIQSYNETKGKIILSDLCVAEISGDEEAEEDFAQFPFFQHDGFFDDMPLIKSEPVDDVKVEPIDDIKLEPMSP